MMKNKIPLLIVLIIVLGGCAAGGREAMLEEERKFRDQMSYEYQGYSEEEYINDYGRILQKERLTNNTFDSYTDPTTTELSQEISNRLMENRDIIMTEVHELEDKIYVAVMLSDNSHNRSHEENIIPYIEEQVKAIPGTEDKQIVVWTDHTEWNEIKNEESTPEIIKYFNDFFENNRQGEYRR